MTGRLPRLVAVLLAPALLIAALGAGLAPSRSPEPRDPAMGGRLADLCGGDHGHGAPHCEACQLVGAAPPEPSGDWLPLVAGAAFRAPVTAPAAMRAAAHDRSRTSRGPPSRTA